LGGGGEKKRIHRAENREKEKGKGSGGILDLFPAGLRSEGKKKKGNPIRSFGLNKEKKKKEELDLVSALGNFQLSHLTIRRLRGWGKKREKKDPLYEADRRERKK